MTSNWPQEAECVHETPNRSIETPRLLGSLCAGNSAGCRESLSLRRTGSRRCRPNGQINVVLLCHATWRKGPLTAKLLPEGGEPRAIPVALVCLRMWFPFAHRTAAVTCPAKSKCRSGLRGALPQRSSGRDDISGRTIHGQRCCCDIRLGVGALRRAVQADTLNRSLQGGAARGLSPVASFRRRDSRDLSRLVGHPSVLTQRGLCAVLP